ncbi:MAG TPA: glycine zipper family protein [Gammaproteobacteria bacterium]|nr:glycine zipper family protein [Gammaproteobacteria bacterium]
MIQPMTWPSSGTPGCSAILLIVVIGLLLAACSAAPTREAATERAQPTPPPPTQVYFYPTRGQNADQQERDRYECYLWAVKQSGFDPSQPNLAPHQRIEVVPQIPPGQDTAVGAVTGAVIGAVVASPGHSAEGAVVGAVVGTIAGATSESARADEVARAQQRVDQREARRRAELEQQAANYRRAMTACLEGRGYTVR